MYRGDLEQAELGKHMDIMVWSYVEDIDHFVDSHTWHTYSHTFPSIWVASAFKGRRSAMVRSVLMDSVEGEREREERGRERGEVKWKKIFKSEREREREKKESEKKKFKREKKDI